MLKIGNIELKYPLVLAPLAGISDLPYRLTARSMGCELAFIEMISVHAITRANKKTLGLLTQSREDKPLGVQFLGRDPEQLHGAWEMVKDMGYALVDLTAACPVKKVIKRREGAALAREPEALYKAVKTLVEAADVPVTCKIRAGWDADSLNAVEAARAVEEAGASALFIHGRTRTQMYRGEVDYNIIGLVKNSVNIPVIGSGDVFSAVHARRMLDRAGVDGVAMARGSMGNPWIFRETIALLETGELPEKPGIEEIVCMMKMHLALCLEKYGPGHAPIIFRKLFIWYTKGMHSVKPLRLRAVRTTSAEEHLRLIDELRLSNLP